MSAGAEERRIRVIGVVCLAAAILGAVVFLGNLFLDLGGAFGDRDLPECDEWEFDAEAWKHEREETAQMLVECETLIGLSRREAGEMLGKRHVGDTATWTFPAGAANDYLGPGDANYLHVHFGDDDRAERAGLRYGGERAGLD